MKSLKLTLGATLAFWLIIWGVMIGQQELILNKGKEVILKTIPLDPRDLLRGDYVILDYEVFESARSQRNFEYLSDGTIYLILRQKSDKRVNFSRVTDRFPDREDLVLKATKKGDRIVSSIGKYFVPEGQGKELEKERNARNMEVVLRVNRRGEARIEDILIGGK